MNPAYISALAALAGSVIGGLTTFAAAWVTQRQQANVQWLLQEKTRRLDAMPDAWDRKELWCRGCGMALRA